jgi:hypothetical protein
MSEQQTHGQQHRLHHGLPGPLPPGEVVIWQGAPDWRALARRALHIHQFAVYFAVLLAWAIGTAMWQHGVFDPAIVPTLVLVPLALAALGLLTLFGWLAARTTTYWITNRRVIMQFGVALPMTVNIPFRLINAASASSGADGSGDIALSLSDGDRLAYLIMWPHVRPWRLARTEPSLRGITHVSEVAQVLSRALAASAAQPVAPVPAAYAQRDDHVAAHPAAA